MDNSEQYIKMCGKAGEIQTIWSSADCSLSPSFVYDTVTKSVSIMIWAPSKLALIIRKEYPSQGNSLIASIEWWNEKHIGFEDTEDFWRSDTIWLPRQDQLQEMVRKPKHSQSPVRLVYRFYEWLESTASRYEDGVGYFSNCNLNYESLEQLWLSFVMKKRYEMTWDGNDWAKEENNGAS